jgi:hypothetical protein
MDSTRIPRKVWVGKFCGRRPVGRPQLRWEGIRRGSSFPLNIRGWRRLAGVGLSGGKVLKRPWSDVGCQAIEEEEEEEMDILTFKLQ